MSAASPSPSAGLPGDLSRYSRQVLFAPLGEEGQRRLLASRVLLVGCGALGTALADTLVRAGVGHLRLVDRDYVELSNLQRQILFDESDVAANLPKAEAARAKLQRINSTVQVEAVVADATHRNLEHLAAGADLLLDGTDNFETRFLINDLAVKSDRPWIYGACVGATGLAMVIRPGHTPCLRCVFEQAPPPELNPTCDTAGILAPVVHRVVSHQSMEALKILAGQWEVEDCRLLSFDAWRGRSVSIDVRSAREQGDCACCKRHQFEYLEGRLASGATALCGREAVQITPPLGAKVDFAAMAERLKPAASGPILFNAFLLKAEIERYQVTVFADGRAIIKGTTRPDEARAVYARYIGG